MTEQGERLAALEKGMSVLEGEMRLMRTDVVPAIHDSLSELAQDIRTITNELVESRTDRSWLKSNLGWVLQLATTLMVMWIGYNVVEQPAGVQGGLRGGVHQESGVRAGK